MSSVVSILIIEVSEPADGLIQDLVAFLEERENCQIRTFPTLHNPDDQSSWRLVFPGLELRVKEQAVYRNNELSPLSHYEFFTLYYLVKHPGWVFSKNPERGTGGLLSGLYKKRKGPQTYSGAHRYEAAAPSTGDTSGMAAAGGGCVGEFRTGVHE